MSRRANPHSRSAAPKRRLAWRGKRQSNFVISLSLMTRRHDNWRAAEVCHRERVDISVTVLAPTRIIGEDGKPQTRSRYSPICSRRVC